MPQGPGRRVGRLGFFFALAALAAALALSVAVARAGEGLYLRWTDCANGAGLSSVNFGCVSNTGEQRLYCSFTLPVPLNEVLGIEAVVDLQAAATTLPDWWHLEPPDIGLGLPAGCRLGSLSASQDFTGEVSCSDPWLNRGAAIIQGYTPGEPRGGSAQARIKAVATLPPTFVASLDATHMYHGLKILIQNANPGSCAGCLTHVCLVLNSIWVRRTLGAAGGDQLLVTPGAVGSNWATWQGSSNLDCLTVPVRRATWGQIKSLYR